MLSQLQLVSWCTLTITLKCIYFHSIRTNFHFQKQQLLSLSIKLEQILCSRANGTCVDIIDNKHKMKTILPKRRRAMDIQWDDSKNSSSLLCEHKLFLIITSERRFIDITSMMIFFQLFHESTPHHSSTGTVLVNGRNIHWAMIPMYA